MEDLAPPSTFPSGRTDPAALLDILLEDGPLLAVNKPAGVLIEAPPGIDSVVARVKAYLKDREGKTGNVYLGVPHRLDRPVTGVVLFAKNSKAAARLAAQFRDRLVKKTYWAIVEGRPDPPAGTLIDWLAKAPNEARALALEGPRGDAREAILHYRTVGGTPLGTALEIDLGTGRFHQIRAQLAHHGWPIVGDGFYGRKEQEQPEDDALKDATSTTHPNPGPAAGEGTQQFGPMALHAARLTLFHPVRYDLVSVAAPPPGWWPAQLVAETASPVQT